MTTVRWRPVVTCLNVSTCFQFEGFLFGICFQFKSCQRKTFSFNLKLSTLKAVFNWNPPKTYTCPPSLWFPGIHPPSLALPRAANRFQGSGCLYLHSGRSLLMQSQSCFASAIFSPSLVDFLIHHQDSAQSKSPKLPASRKTCRASIWPKTC